MALEDMDEKKLEEEVAKATEEETVSATTTEETSEETTESTGTETPLKTEEEVETSKEETKEEDEETRFDKHPRWQQLKQERDEALERASQADNIKNLIGDLSTEEILKFKDATVLLRKYPELAEKIQKVIDEHPYGTEEVTRRIDDVSQKTVELEEKLLLKDYDEKVDKLLIQHKVDKDIEPYVRELLDNRVINRRIKLEDMPKAFEDVVKDIEKIRRKTLASHIEDKSRETKIPSSTTERGKVVVSKKESAELPDIISELAEGIKSASAPFKEE